MLNSFAYYYVINNTNYCTNTNIAYLFIFSLLCNFHSFPQPMIIILQHFCGLVIIIFTIVRNNNNSNKIVFVLVLALLGVWWR